MIDSQSFSNWRFLSLCLATHQWCLTGNPCGWCYYSKPDFRHGSRPGIGLEDQKLPRARCPPPNLFGRFISLWCLHNIGCEMESQPEDVKWMWPRVWLSPDAGKRFFFFNLLSCKSVNLFSAAKTNKLDDDDIYYTQPQKEGDYLRQKKWVCCGPWFLPVQHTWLTTKIVLRTMDLSFSLSFFFSPPSMNLGVDKIIPMEDPNKGPAWGEITGACVYTYSPGVWGNTLSVADRT